MNCTTVPLELRPPGENRFFTSFDVRMIVDKKRKALVALVVSPTGTHDVPVISPQGRDANAHLFAHAAEMLQLLIDQEALASDLARLTYDEACMANAAFARRRTELLERMKAVGVVSEEGS